MHINVIWGGIGEFKNNRYTLYWFTTKILSP
jgi:hypothetical protein